MKLEQKILFSKRLEQHLRKCQSAFVKINKGEVNDK